MYLLTHDLGHVTGEAGGYWVGGDLYAPDAACVSYARAAELASKGYSPDAPELAVEVISDPDSGYEQAVLRRKLAGYLAAGVLVWIVNPFARTVEVYTPGSTSVPVLDEAETLNGGTVLPGLRIPVSDIFPRPRPAPAPETEGSGDTGA